MDATARVKGNGPKGCILLAEYKRIITKLKAHQKESSEYPSLGRAIDEMLKWLIKYQKETLESEAIVLATSLNPRFRTKFFTVFYPEHEFSSSTAIQVAFDNLVLEYELPDPSPQILNGTLLKSLTNSTSLEI